MRRCFKEELRLLTTADTPADRLMGGPAFVAREAIKAMFAHKAEATPGLARHGRPRVGHAELVHPPTTAARTVALAAVCHK